ncbi:DUF5133 domain-containing protein [Streptomyces sp. NPDC002911]
MICKGAESDACCQLRTAARDAQAVTAAAIGFRRRGAQSSGPPCGTHARLGASESSRRLDDVSCTRCVTTGTRTVPDALAAEAARLRAVTSVGSLGPASGSADGAAGCLTPHNAQGVAPVLLGRRHSPVRTALGPRRHDTPNGRTAPSNG